MKITEQDAKDCQHIINFLSTKEPYPAYPSVICGGLFANRINVGDVQRLLSIISTNIPGAIDYKMNNGQVYAMRNSNTHIIAQSNGVINWYNNYMEEKEIKVISDAKLWFETEGARRMFEDYPKEKRLAKNTRRWAISAVIISGLVMIIEVTKLILQMKSSK